MNTSGQVAGQGVINYHGKIRVLLNVECTLGVAGYIAVAVYAMRRLTLSTAIAI